MSDVKYPIALLNGERVHINQFSTTQKGVIFICPKCSERLVANISFKKTKSSNWTINRKNFFSHHNSDSLCPGGGESDIHKWAAELIKNKKYLFVPNGNSKYRKIDFIEVDIVNLSVGYGDKLFKCDAKGIRDNNKDILIEFFYKHKCENDKIVLYRKNKIPSIEIDISKVFELDISNIDDYILKNSPRKWIFKQSKINTINPIENSKPAGWFSVIALAGVIGTGIFITIKDLLNKNKE